MTKYGVLSTYFKQLHTFLVGQKSYVFPPDLSIASNSRLRQLIIGHTYTSLIEHTAAELIEVQYKRRTTHYFGIPIHMYDGHTFI